MSLKYEPASEPLTLQPPDPQAGGFSPEQIRTALPRQNTELIVASIYDYGSIYSANLYQVLFYNE